MIDTHLHIQPELDDGSEDFHQAMEDNEKTSALTPVEEKTETETGNRTRTRTRT